MSDRAKKREEVLNEVKLKRLKEAVIWKNAFGTEDGQTCLSLLKRHFYDTDAIASNDPIVTQTKAAQRDLVRYIINQVEFTGE